MVNAICHLPLAPYTVALGVQLQSLTGLTYQTYGVNKLAIGCSRVKMAKYCYLFSYRSFEALQCTDCATMEKDLILYSRFLI